MAVGATRHGDQEYFLDEINHPVYAADTALHIAAAAYEPGLTRALVNAGAHTRERRDGGRGAARTAPSFGMIRSAEASLHVSSRGQSNQSTVITVTPVRTVSGYEEDSVAAQPAPTVVALRHRRRKRRCRSRRASTPPRFHGS